VLKLSVKKKKLIGDTFIEGLFLDVSYVESLQLHQPELFSLGFEKLRA
jgi:hypothetical protein